MRAVELPQRGRAAEHNGSAENGSRNQLDGAARGTEGAMHLLVLALCVLKER
jgi:hypothetical protein